MFIAIQTTDDPLLGIDLDTANSLITAWCEGWAELTEARHNCLRAWLPVSYLTRLLDEQDLLNLAGYFVQER